MEVKEFLKSTSEINLTWLAKKMWPDNKGAKSYLSTKLHDNGRKWTAKDEERAAEFLSELGIRLSSFAPPTS